MLDRPESPDSVLAFEAVGKVSAHDDTSVFEPAVHDAAITWAAG